MKILRWMLFPFAQLYALTMAIRNFMFDIGFFEQTQYPVPIIAVGNLSTGGTGKTPFVEYLIELLPKEKNIAVLSRGYGRKTTGVLFADNQSTADSIGDEPFQLFRKFGDRVLIVVAEKRRQGVDALLQHKQTPDLILLDDAYQHRWVKRDLNILLTPYAQPFFGDWTLPTGNLRESRFEAKRADMVVVTKSPDLDPENKSGYERRIKKLAGDAVLLFSTITYGHLLPAFDQVEGEVDEVITLCGIANPSPFLDYVGQQFSVQDQLVFPDHHAFTHEELDSLHVKLSKNTLPIVTTEKDMVRLLAFKEHDLFEQHRLFYMPIALQMDNRELLIQQVMKLV